jgi:hypothetical protein
MLYPSQECPSKTKSINNEKGTVDPFNLADVIFGSFTVGIYWLSFKLAFLGFSPFLALGH